jgi:ABC-2 type transport system ATP-binding protein
VISIDVINVEKNYGSIKAVNTLSFSVQAGQIFALLGPNGAGKSSLIRMLVGLTMPDAGEIRIGYQGEVRGTIPEGSFAYLPEDRGLYLDRSVSDNLHYIAKLRGMTKAQIQEQLAHWLPRFDLLDKTNEKLSKLSKGNQQKVQLISCLIHQPKLLILDEPFSGLDPINQEHVLTILKELKQAGTTILLSAHQMALVERLADQMLLLNHGQQVAMGSLDEVIKQLSPQRDYLVSFNQATSLSQLQNLNCASNVTARSNEQFQLTLMTGFTVNQLLQELMNVAEIVDFSRLQPSLHELYLNAVQEHNMQQKTQTMQGVTE